MLSGDEVSATCCTPSPPAISTAPGTSSSPAKTSPTRNRAPPCAWTSTPRSNGTARLIGDVLPRIGDLPQSGQRVLPAAFYLSDDPVAFGRPSAGRIRIAHRSGRLLDKWVHYFPDLRPRTCVGSGTGPFRARNRCVESSLRDGTATSARRQSSSGSTSTLKPPRGPTGRMTVLIGDAGPIPRSLVSIVERYGAVRRHHRRRRPHNGATDHVDRKRSSPPLNDGGVCIVEDCHTSYWAEFGWPRAAMAHSGVDQGPPRRPACVPPRRAPPPDLGRPRDAIPLLRLRGLSSTSAAEVRAVQPSRRVRVTSCSTQRRHESDARQSVTANAMRPSRNSTPPEPSVRGASPA